MIPIIIRECDWKTAPFAELQALPTDGTPVTEQPSRDAAWTDVVEGLRRALGELSSHPPVRPVDHHGRKPRYSDDETQRLSTRLKDLYRRRKNLTAAGGSTEEVDSKILDVRRHLRKGPQLRAGEFLDDGRYELLEPVGQGGFATVWRAWDTEAEAQVAVKVLHGHLSDDRSRRERFCRSARKMAELIHPHIVRVLEHELLDDGWRFFVMEYADGGNFEQAVLDGELGLPERLRNLTQVGEVLADAHQRGIIHRDVKPSNVLLDGRGEAKLTDFDLVRAQDTTGLTATRAMMGTVQFAAPEALTSAGSAGQAADVYGLGSTAVFALTGRRLPSWYFRDPAKVIAELDCIEELKLVLRRATAFEIENRLPSVLELCRALETAAQSLVVVPTEEVEAEDPLVRPLPIADLPDRDRFAAVEKKGSGFGKLAVLGILLAILAVTAGPGLVRWLSPPDVPPANAGGLPPVAALELPEPGSHEAGALWEGSIGMKFRHIPAGKFDMGSPETEPGRYDDEVLHEVTLTRAFAIGETEVTQGQWRELMDSDPSAFGNCGDECPVERISWFEAVEFANRLSDTVGLDKCYELTGCSGTLGGGCEADDPWWCEAAYTCQSVAFAGLDCEGFRLPTEAEWEYAARAGEAGAIYTGALTLHGANNGPELDAIAWYGGNSGVDYDGGYDCSDWPEKQEPADRCGTHPVRHNTKAPNAWGLSDMLGNVWEWTGDWKGYYESAAMDPTGPAKGSTRVVRGGSWDKLARYCRSANRGIRAPGDRDSFIGFRLVRTLP